MPLYPNAARLIRANLEALQRGERVRAVAIGTLTSAQLSAINQMRAAYGTPGALPPIIDEVLFVGHHVYKSRCIRDGYTINDVLDQVAGAMDATAVSTNTNYMTAIENPTARTDRYGNEVRDRAIFECTTRHPRPELFSVVPKGDTIKPKK